MSYDLDTPGTVRIIENAQHVESEGEIRLIPTPSSDPEDPLNWSPNRKRIQLACLALYTFASAVSATSLSAIYEPLSAQTGLTLDQLNVGSGYSYFLIGLSTLILQPAALAFGKRPVYVLSAAASAAITIWLAFLKGNSQWIGIKLLLGFTSGPSFSLVEVSIADYSFLHERTTPMGLYVCLLYAGALLSPILGGYIYSGLGWKAVIWMTAGLLGITALILFVFLEETNYKCDTPYDTPEAEQPALGLSEAASDDKDDKAGNHDMIQLDVAFPRSIGQWPGPRPWKFGRRSPYARGIMWRGFIQPIALMPSPLIFWCGIMYGMYQVYFNRKSYVLFGVTIADSAVFSFLSSGVLSAPPYNFAPNSVGLTWLSPLVTCIPGAIFGGYMADKYAVYRAKKNNGICEPEHKLQLFIFPAVFIPIGLLMMGLGPYYEAHWIVYVLGEGVVNLVGPIATVLVLTYAFDCFHPIQPDDLTGVHASVQDSAPYLICTMVIAMCLTFGFGYAITPWAFGWGFKNFAISAALSSLVLNASVVVIYRYGKRLRRAGQGYYGKIINW